MSWLDDIKAGDEVLISTTMRIGLIKCKVVRATKTQITAHGFKWRRSDGRRVGENSRFHCSRLIEPTEENMAAWELDNLRDRFYELCRMAKRTTYSAETMRAVVEMLDADDGQ